MAIENEEEKARRKKTGRDEEKYLNISSWLLVYLPSPPLPPSPLPSFFSLLPFFNRLFCVYLFSFDSLASAKRWVPFPVFLRALASETDVMAGGGEGEGEERQEMGRRKRDGRGMIGDERGEREREEKERWEEEEERGKRRLIREGR